MNWLTWTKLLSETWENWTVPPTPFAYHPSVLYNRAGDESTLNDAERIKTLSGR